jgi:hypothetical protein
LLTYYLFMAVEFLYSQRINCASIWMHDPSPSAAHPQGLGFSNPSAINKERIASIEVPDKKNDIRQGCIRGTGGENPTSLIIGRTKVFKACLSNLNREPMKQEATPLMGW